MRLCMGHALAADFDAAGGERQDGGEAHTQGQGQAHRQSLYHLDLLPGNTGAERREWRILSIFRLWKKLWEKLWEKLWKKKK